MGKFKIGDRVRVLPRDRARAFSGHGASAGNEYTVKPVRGYAGDNIDTELWSFFDHEIELIPTLTISADKFYRTRGGKLTGRVTKGATGFEAVVDGKVRIYDAAGGHVHGDADLDIVEAWVPRVGERVVVTYGSGWDGEGLVDHIADANQNIIVELETGERAGFRGGFTSSQVEPLPVAVPQPAAALKIEAGKFYRTRDGRKVGPAVRDTKHAFGKDGFVWRVGTLTYKDNGFFGWIEDSADLIAEWVDEPAPAAVAPEVAEASNDNKLKFKVGDRVFAQYGGLRGNGTVTRVDTDDDHIPYRVDFGAEGSFWCYDEDVTSPQPEAGNGEEHAAVQNSLAITIDTGNVHEELDEIIAKLKKIKKLQRQVGLAA